MMNIINFDHNSTTKILPVSLAKMNEIYAITGNASSIHSIGRKLAMIIEEARENLAQKLNAKSYEIFFTSSGTEANNMALLSFDFEKIFLSKIEHSSVYNVKPKNCEIIELKIDKNCQISLSDVEEKLSQNSSKNFLVSVMLANNETGAIQQVKQIAQITHQNGGLIHSDLVHAFGKIKIDLEDLNVDFATISSHKINGPQGVGALLVRKGLDIKPLIFGGGQEKGKRSGSINSPAIAAFGEAVKLIDEKINKMLETAKLRDFIESELQKIAGDNLTIFAKNSQRTPNTCYFSLKNVDNQTQLINFDLNQIMVSAGSACSSGTLQNPRILQGMAVKKEFSNPIRISLSEENTSLEAEKFIEVFNKFYIRTKP